MTRAGRMAPVQRVLGKAERDRARELGEAQQRLADAEARLRELTGYHADYQRTLRQRVEAGVPVLALRDFQAFLARLEAALRQQQQLVDAAREQAEASRLGWQGAARQVKAVASVVGRWQQAEAQLHARREQKDSDELALRAGARAGRSDEVK